MAPASRKQQQDNDQPVVHLATVGTTPPGFQGPDVIDALIAELKPEKPRRLVVLATADSADNAERLRKGLGVPPAATRIRAIATAQSLDEAYQAASEEIAALLAEGVSPSRIVLHYTAGTKVMSAGAVMAALRYEIQSLRYLFSPGRGHKSESVITSPRTILLDQRLNLAVNMIREMRFRSAIDLLRTVEGCDASPSQLQQLEALRFLAQAYLDWDNFRTGDFLRRYEGGGGQLAKIPSFAAFRVEAAQLESLRRVAAAEDTDGSFPEELLLDLINNSIRRLAERHPDDAIIRLHRAAELYAQTVLAQDHGIRTDDVEIRKVPPRYRSGFESERRLDDATIKLGLRKSYELLAALGNPVGAAFQANEGLRELLRQRRALVLGHGTRPATMNQALTFLKAVEDLLSLRITNLRERNRRLQFPWIDNDDVLRRLGRAPAVTESVIVTPDAKPVAKKPRKTRKAS